MGAMDSSADLLFRIGADPSDAENNVRRLRAVMGKELGDLKSEVGTWAKDIFGELNTIQGVATAGVAAGLAGLAALAVGAVKVGEELWAAGEKAAHYAEEIEDGMDKTGLSAEAISGLRYAAKNAGVGYEELVAGLVKFEAAVVAAQDPQSKEAKTLHDLGVSQKEIAAGARDLYPLLMKTADGFREHANGALKATAARTEFGRSGANFVEWLNQGSEGMRRLAGEAERMGLVLTEKDIAAAKAFKLEMIALNAQMEGLKIQVGTGVLPVMGQLAVMLEAYAKSAPKIFEIYKNQEWWKAAIPGGREIAAVRAGVKIFEDELLAAQKRLAERVRAAMAEGTKPMPLAGPEVKEATQGYWGLTSVLEQVKLRLAGATSEEAKITAETAHLKVELAKAGEEFLKLWNEGKLGAETVKRETEALYTLPGAIQKYGVAAIADLFKKRNQAVREAGVELAQMLAQQQEQTWQRQQEAWRREIEGRRQKLAAENKLDAENQRLLAEVEEAGLRRIERERSEGYMGDLRELQRSLADMVTARMTAQERIAWQYDQDLTRFSDVEKQKTLVRAGSEAERAADEQQYELNRAAALRRYEEGLNALRNSEGWRGVFGAEFGEMIRGNESLLREWATTADRGMLMLRVTLEGLGQMLRKTFQDFANAMGQNIAQAIVYRKSIGEAVREAAAATLASIAAKAYVEAIYATALGFMLLAERDYGGAAQAFTAAGWFATIGTATAVAGRMMAPRQGSSGGAGAGSGGGSSAGTSSGGGGSTGTAEPAGPRVAVYIYGHVIGASGIEELTEIINDAVKDRDVRLIATQVKQGQRLIR